MTLYNFANGTAADADEVDDMFEEAFTAAGLNLIRQLQDRSVDLSNGQIDGFAEAYTSSGGRRGTVNTGKTSATFNTDEYQARGFSESVYVIIEADDVDENSMASGDIKVNKKTLDNRWLVWVDSADSDAVKRAKIYERLFDDKKIVNNTTNVQKVETSVSRDVDKRAYRTFDRVDSDEFETDVKGGNQQRDITFSSTSGNTDVSFWSDISVSQGDGNQNPFGQLEVPKGSDVNRVDTNGTNNEIGTDTTGDETDNPSDSFVEVDTDTGMNDALDNGPTAEVTTIFLTEASVSFNVSTSLNGDGQDAEFTSTSTDFTGGQNIPAFSSDSSNNIAESYFNVVNHTISTSTKPSTSIGVPLISNWESGAGIEYRLRNSSGDDTGWLTAKDPIVSEFSQFSNPPDELIVRLLRASSPSNDTPSIKGFYLRTTS